MHFFLFAVVVDFAGHPHGTPGSATTLTHCDGDYTQLHKCYAFSLIILMEMFGKVLCVVLAHASKCATVASHSHPDVTPLSVAASSFASGLVIEFS